MRNAVQRRPHRERAQPLERKRLGLLEKHKDYSLRAKDYNKKQEHLKKLRQKASERNEDEFYFGMLSREGPGSRIMQGKGWSGTVKGDRGNKVLDMNTARLLKTQDVGYIRTMKQIVRKEVARLEQQIVLTQQVNGLEDDAGADDDFDDDDDDEMLSMPMSAKPKAPKKIIFADDEDEREAVMDADMDADSGSEDGSEFQGLDDEKEAGAAKEEPEAVKSLRRLKRKLENERKKLKALTDAERELDVQRGNMAKKGTVIKETRRGKKVAVRTRKR